MTANHQRGRLDGNFTKDEKGTITIKTKALNIIWGGSGSNGRYWQMNKDDTMELVGVYWLEVSGSIGLNHLKPGSTYSLTFSVKLTDLASGWGIHPVVFRVRLPGPKAVTKQVKFSLYENKKEWFEAPEGGLEFIAPPNTTNAEMLNFGMYEIECEHWKKGLIIKDVKITCKN
eukprot:TRINITY_DN6508_c0_g1_i1.p1 TRINITY_DN6508_c0_g1~~TRINITY_DN6508_c0_g1_i1.p1  ORF type:complete len:183 (-),score=25.60 TRINITY_DN6508_c0_g1_i1:81-599(-)